MTLPFLAPFLSLSFLSLPPKLADEPDTVRVKKQACQNKTISTLFHSRCVTGRSFSSPPVGCVVFLLASQRTSCLQL